MGREIIENCFYNDYGKLPTDGVSLGSETGNSANCEIAQCFYNRRITVWQSGGSDCQVSIDNRDLVGGVTAKWMGKTNVT